MMATSFWYQAVLNAVGPVVTAVVGSLLIGTLVQAITRGAQDRRAARELRHALIAELTGVAAKLHVRLQMYRRERDLLDAAENASASHAAAASLAAQAPHPDEGSRWSAEQFKEQQNRLTEHLRQLHEQYRECRRDGAVLEARLGAHFADPRVQTAWHAVTDCLILRYCDAIDYPGVESVRDVHAYGKDGRFHSGLLRNQLGAKDSWTQLERAHAGHLEATSAFVLELPLRGARSTRWERVLGRRPGQYPSSATPGAFTYRWAADSGPRCPPGRRLARDAANPSDTRGAVP